MATVAKDRQVWLFQSAVVGIIGRLYDYVKQRKEAFAQKKIAFQSFSPNGLTGLCWSVFKAVSEGPVSRAELTRLKLRGIPAHVKQILGGDKDTDWQHLPQKLLDLPDNRKGIRLPGIYLALCSLIHPVFALSV